MPILDNNSNIWINANAGSGKTSVLIKRILSLILSGADVNKIVAITYTNVGAQEIYDRFLAAALRWSTIDQDLLTKELGELIENVDDNVIQIAKNLHNNIMLNGNDLQVGTIHSFCQSILEQISLQSNGTIECFNIDNDAINGTAIETVTDKTLEYLDSMATANADNEIVSKYILGDLSKEQIRKMIENIRSF